MKSKVIVLIFGESLSYKSGLGLFVAELEVEVEVKVQPNMSTFVKSAQVGASKKGKPNLQRKTASNQKIQEMKPVLKFSFTYE